MLGHKTGGVSQNAVRVTLKPIIARDLLTRKFYAFRVDKCYVSLYDCCDSSTRKFLFLYLSNHTLG